jgi:hypothetical protein
MGETRHTYQHFAAISEGSSHLQDPHIVGRIILNRILDKQGGRLWNGFKWLRIRCSGRPFVNKV